MDIHAKGGGIHYTVDCVHRASFDHLYASLTQRLTTMLRGGTTLVEAKSGYGLDLENEYKMLRVIEKAKQEHPITISSTYCGAHAVPRSARVSTECIDTVDSHSMDCILPSVDCTLPSVDYADLQSR